MIIKPFSKKYEGDMALEFSGITLEKGKIYGVVGANGSGKSTFAKVVSGVIPSDNKERVFDGTVGYMSQNSFAFRMSTKDNILIANKDEKRAEMLMKELNLCHLKNKKATKLSGGETARMAMARLMMKQFDLVILDEPTAAMDMEMTKVSEEMIKKYVSKTGCALIIISHNIKQTERLSDYVWFFHEGELLEAGETDKVLTSPANPKTLKFLDFYA